jgi:DNA-directed RNA polymerase specialized sigma24 family protein
VEVSDLTPGELEALLRLLDPDRNRAGEIYEDNRRRLIRLFEWWGCDEPERQADETINRVARQAAQGLSFQTDPPRYFRGVANLVFKEWLRHKASQNKALEAGEWPPQPADEEESEDRRLACLRDCLSLLPGDQSSLLLRYHQGENNKQMRRQICEELGIEMNALRIRVHRLRRRVETCVEEKMR